MKRFLALGAAVVDIDLSRFVEFARRAKRDLEKKRPSRVEWMDIKPQASILFAAMGREIFDEMAYFASKGILDEYFQEAK